MLSKEEFSALPSKNKVADRKTPSQGQQFKIKQKHAFLDHPNKHFVPSCQGYSKVNSVQEACAKCFAVHILKFEILQIT